MTQNDHFLCRDNIIMTNGYAMVVVRDSDDIVVELLGYTCIVIILDIKQT